MPAPGSVAGCGRGGGGKPEVELPVVHTEAVMGTVASFRVLVGPLTRADTVREVRVACALLHRADEVFSTWIADSPMSRLRRGEVDIDDVPDEIAEVLSQCRAAKELSGGWFDPWAMPGGVDPTGLVKGWALEAALGSLVAAGVRAAIVNAGGDLAAVGGPRPGEPWRVGIQHPWRSDALAGVVRLDAALATSGSYERGAHLLDPHTGAPTTAVASASVAGPSLAMADALATGLAVGGEEALGSVPVELGYTAYLIGADGSEATAGPFPFDEADEAPATASA